MSVEERIQGVVVEFCEIAHVTQGFKWNGVKEQLLQTLTIEAGLQELTDDMKKRVKAYVNPPPVLPAPPSPSYRHCHEASKDGSRGLLDVRHLRTGI